MTWAWCGKCRKLVELDPQGLIASHPISIEQHNRWDRIECPWTGTTPTPTPEDK